MFGKYAAAIGAIQAQFGASFKGVRALLYGSSALVIFEVRVNSDSFPKRIRGHDRKGFTPLVGLSASPYGGVEYWRCLLIATSLTCETL